MKSFEGHKNKMCDEFANFVLSLTENRVKKSWGREAKPLSADWVRNLFECCPNSLLYSPCAVFIEADCLYRLLMLYVCLFCLFNSFIQTFLFCDVFLFLLLFTLISDENEFMVAAKMTTSNRLKSQYLFTHADKQEQISINVQLI